MLSCKIASVTSLHNAVRFHTEWQSQRRNGTEAGQKILLLRRAAEQSHLLNQMNVRLYSIPQKLNRDFTGYELLTQKSGIGATQRGHVSRRKDECYNR